jgi:hypothetical protein
VGANLTGIALALFGLQLVCAAAVLSLSFRARGSREPVAA